MRPVSLLSSRRPAVTLCLTLAALPTFLVARADAETAPARAAAVTCSVKNDGRRLGTTYVTSLRVTQVSCTKAKSVVKAFNACRRADGDVAGRCRSTVQGFRCTEKRGATIPTQYSSRVVCTAGGRAVRFAYTQFT
jgi:hypothetical protein